MMNNPVIELLNDDNKKFVKVCAPMVRYSKYVFYLKFYIFIFLYMYTCTLLNNIIVLLIIL